MSAAGQCDAGHAMRVVSRFRFDHEPGDSPDQTEALEQFRRAGIHLGDDVTVWRCDACDETTAIFTPPRGERAP